MSEIAKHWMDGEWTESGTVSESINPATGEVLGQWADGGEAEARAAIAAARRAFDTSHWSRDPSLRNQALHEMADRFEARADEALSSGYFNSRASSEESGFGGCSLASSCASASPR